MNIPERCSVNGIAAFINGLIVGSAAYADMEPHHVEGAYTNMHHPGRERLLCMILDGIYTDDEGGDERPMGRLSAKIHLREFFPKLSDDPGRDYAAAERGGTIRSVMMRNNCGVIEPISLNSGDGFSIFCIGWDMENHSDGEWTVDYFDAEIMRE